MKNIKYCNPPVAAVPQQQQQQQRPTQYGIKVYKNNNGVVSEAEFIDNNGNGLIIGCIILLFLLVSRLGKSKTTTYQSGFFDSVTTRYPYEEIPQRRICEPCKRM